MLTYVFLPRVNRPVPFCRLDRSSRNCGSRLQEGGMFAYSAIVCPLDFGVDAVNNFEFNEVNEGMNE